MKGAVTRARSTPSAKVRETTQVWPLLLAIAPAGLECCAPGPGTDTTQTIDGRSLRVEQVAGFFDPQTASVVGDSADAVQIEVFPLIGPVIIVTSADRTPLVAGDEALAGAARPEHCGVSAAEGTGRYRDDDLFIYPPC